MYTLRANNIQETKRLFEKIDAKQREYHDNSGKDIADHEKLMIVWVAMDSSMVKELKELKIVQGDVELGAAGYAKVRENVMAIIQSQADRDSLQASIRKNDDDMQLCPLGDAEHEYTQEEWDEWENGDFDDSLNAFGKGKGKKGQQRGGAGADKGKKQLDCWKCGGIGHPSFMCKFQIEGSTVVCDNCKGTGH